MMILVAVALDAPAANTEDDTAGTSTDLTNGGQLPFSSSSSSSGTVPSVTTTTTTSSPFISASVSAQLSSALLQTKASEEQCIISSSEAEDHLYTSLTTRTPEIDSPNNSTTIAASKPQTSSSSSSKKNSNRSRNRRKVTTSKVELPPPSSPTSSGSTAPANSSNSKSRRRKNPRSGSSKGSGARKSTEIKLQANTPAATSTPATASISASSDASLFGRFYLQRQPDGTSVLFVPAGEQSGSLKRGLTHLTSNSNPSNSASIITNPRQPSLLILGEATSSSSSSTPAAVVPQLASAESSSQPILMRIEKSSLVAPLVTLLDGPSTAPMTDLFQHHHPSTSSLTSSSPSPLSSTTFSLTGKGLLASPSSSSNLNNNNSASNMRSNGSFSQPQPQQQHQQHSQSRAILSAHKQQQMQQQQQQQHNNNNSSSSLLQEQLASPPLLMTQSSAIKSMINHSALSVDDAVNGGGGSINGALPPVGTIMRTSSIGSGTMQRQQTLSPVEQLYSVPGFNSDFTFDDEDLTYVPYGNCNVDATEDCFTDLISTASLSSSATSSPLLLSTSAPQFTASGSSVAASSSADLMMMKQPGSQAFHNSTAAAITTTTASMVNGNSGTFEDMVDDDDLNYSSLAAVNDLFDYGCYSHGSHRISPHCAMQATHLMTCDNDPLISGNDVQLKSASSGGAFMRMNGGGGGGNSIHSNGIPIPSSGTARAGGLMGGGSLPATYLMANDYASSMTSTGALFEATDMVKEENLDEDEDDNRTLVGWTNTELSNSAGLFQRQSSSSSSSAMVDLNGQNQNQNQTQTQQQQQISLITSTSSPTMLNGKQQQQQQFWNYDQQQQQNGQMMSGDNTVSSSLLSAIEMDDASPEIETIFQNGAGGSGRGRLNFTTASPPKLSSSLPTTSMMVGGFKSPSTLKQQQQQLMLLKKPILMAPNQHQRQQNGGSHQAPLLTGLLQACSANVNELLRTANGPVLIANASGAAVNVNGGLVSQQQQQQQLFALKSAANNGGQFANCPTLATMIAAGSVATTSSNSASALLSSSLPSIGNFHHGPSMATILQQSAAMNNNRNRNNSMSTDYSVSSHDEGFGSQPDEDDAELEAAGAGNGLISDQCSDDGSLIDEMMMADLMVSGAGGDGLVSDLIGDDVTDPYGLFLSDQQLQSTFDGSFGSNSGSLMLNSGGLPSTATSSDHLTISGSPSPIVIKSEPMWCTTTTATVEAVSRPAEVLKAVQKGSSSKKLLQQQQQYHHQQSEEEAESMVGEGSEEADEDERMVGDDEDDDDESFYGDYDANDLLGASTSDDPNNKWSLNMGRSRKGTEKRFFWQYNVQSKGPKGPRYATGASSSGASSAANGGAAQSDDEEDDPHIFNEIADPVFAPDCQVEGVKHSGKARRGDGNDLTPNPKKLLMIGLELAKLCKEINGLTPVTEVAPANRHKSRKEKNKLASRACRLKKKAQHEANKIKMHGLQREHGKLNPQASALKALLIAGLKMYKKCGGSSTASSPAILTVDGVSYQLAGLGGLATVAEEAARRQQTLQDVAGRTADYVNGVLNNVTDGDFSGGIDNV